MVFERLLRCCTSAATGGTPARSSRSISFAGCGDKGDNGLLLLLFVLLLLLLLQLLLKPELTGVTAVYATLLWPSVCLVGVLLSVSQLAVVCARCCCCCCCCCCCSDWVSVAAALLSVMFLPCSSAVEEGAANACRASPASPASEKNWLLFCTASEGPSVSCAYTPVARLSISLGSAADPPSSAAASPDSCCRSCRGSA